MRPAPEDSGAEYTLAYFPVVATGREIVVATSYAESLGGLGYNRLRTDYERTRSLPVVWCFRRERGAVRYGFVVRRWYPPPPPRRRGGRMDNSDIRVLWVTPKELDDAIQRGALDLPKFDTLPSIDPDAAGRMIQTGDDLVP